MNFLVKITGGQNNDRSFIVEDASADVTRGIADWERAIEIVCERLGMKDGEYEFMVAEPLPLQRSIR